MKRKFLICPVCGNLIEVIDDKNVPIMCCGKKMEELVANSEEASTEKHIPVIEENNNELVIKVGSINHPMEENHYIKWIYVETTKSNYRKNLKPGENPIVTYVINEDEELLNVYEYCNLHGLWKGNI